jgi:hypothetical protein
MLVVLRIHFTAALSRSLSAPSRPALDEAARRFGFQKAANARQKYQQAVKALLTLKQRPARAFGASADLDGGARVNYVVPLHMLRSRTR